MEFWFNFFGNIYPFKIILIPFLCFWPRSVYQIFTTKALVQCGFFLLRFKWNSKSLYGKNHSIYYFYWLFLILIFTSFAITSPSDHKREDQFFKFTYIRLKWCANHLLGGNTLFRRRAIWVKFQLKNKTSTKNHIKFRP